jgi:three-Cys-motif partner protein
MLKVGRIVNAIVYGDLMGFIEAKPHSYRKYSILKKYLEVCKKFSDKYQNFVYIETHGGTGEVIDYETRKSTDGSVLIAAKIQPNFPCYVVEIDPDRFKLLKRSTLSYPNVRLFYGDCNVLIDRILSLVPKGEKFIFCFMDPDGLIYRGYNRECDQLKWETVEKVAKFPRTEVLINVPIQAISRLFGDFKNHPEAPSSISFRMYITNFFGSEKWMKLEPGDYRALVRLYIRERLRGYYNYIGAILIRSVETRGPLYYLVYGSNYKVGGEIMRDILKKEWIDIKGTRPLTRYRYKNDREWLDAEYPLDLFIFED